MFRGGYVMGGYVQGRAVGGMSRDIGTSYLNALLLQPDTPYTEDLTLSRG